MVPTDTKSTILIAGGGLAGLFCALESKRNGFEPTVLEARGNIQEAGDFITIGHSVLRAMEYYPESLAAINDSAFKGTTYYHKHTGEVMLEASSGHSNFGRSLSRRRLHTILMQAVTAAGIEIRCHNKVADYLETESQGGVKLVNGEILWADLVVAADGVHSRSWKLVTGREPEVYSSGLAVFRASFPIEFALKTESLRKNWAPDDKEEKTGFFFGPKSHGILVFSRTDAIWVLVHSDNPETSSESWSATLSADIALRELDEGDGDWSSDFRAMVASTPERHLVDWRLLWRDLIEDWVSPKGRVVQIGDAAHAFLPTSVNGGTQAMEDAVSLSTCLRLAVKRAGNGDDHTLALSEGSRVHNCLRLDRISCIQQSGIKRVTAYRNIDWEAARRDPNLIRQSPPTWQTEHDPERYALDRFEECLYCLRGGKTFENTNSAPGYRHEPWTVQDLLKEHPVNE